MPIPRRIAFSVLALLIAASTSWIGSAMAQSKDGSGQSMTESPYQKGPPPVTGGFTDTWQGGKKTSGDVSGVSGMTTSPGAPSKSVPPSGADKAKKESERAPSDEPRT
jgi:hypothetical protein